MDPGPTAPCISNRELKGQYGVGNNCAVAESGISNRELKAIIKASDVVKKALEVMHLK